MIPIKKSDPKEIDLEFEGQYHGQILSGRKTATSRRTKKGDPGDWFSLKGERFRLVAVDQIPLAQIRTDLYEQEGFSNPDSFRRAWISHFPLVGWVPSDLAWVHFFRKEVKR